MMVGKRAHVKRYNIAWDKGWRDGTGPSSAVLKKVESKTAKKKRRKKGR
jgi:hypothetical protein